MLLRVLLLENLHMTRQSTRYVCFGKRLECIAIRGHSFSYKTAILTGIFEGINTKIKCLTLDIQPPPDIDELLKYWPIIMVAVKSLSHLIKLTLHNCYYQPTTTRANDTTRGFTCWMRELLLLLCLSCPVLRQLRYEDDSPQYHWWHVKSMALFFNHVLPMLTAFDYTIEQKVSNSHSNQLDASTSSRYESSSLVL